MMKFPIIQKNNSSFLNDGEFRRAKLQVNELNMMKEGKTQNCSKMKRNRKNF